MEGKAIKERENKDAAREVALAEGGGVECGCCGGDDLPVRQAEFCSSCLS